ncbi:hypothetical protein [Nocardia sp. NPDC004260]
MWEKLKAAIEFSVAAEPDDARRGALRWALDVAARKADAQLRGEPLRQALAAGA